MINLYNIWVSNKILKEVNKTILEMAPDVPVMLLARRDMLEWSIKYYKQELERNTFLVTPIVMCGGVVVYYTFKYSKQLIGFFI